MIPVLFTPGFLKSSSTSSILEILPQLTDAWNKRQVFRTETEMRISVLNEGYFPTKASKYWQAVREQTMMLEQVTLRGFEYRRNEVRLKRAQLALEVAATPLDKEEIYIEIDQCLFTQAQLRQDGEDRIREIKLWEQIKQELDDGSFDTSDVNAHQLVSMKKQLEARKEALTPQATPEDVINILGPLSSLETLTTGELN